MCTVLLPPGDDPIAVNKYINIESHLEDPEVLSVIFNNFFFYRGWDILILSQG